MSGYDDRLRHLEREAARGDRQAAKALGAARERIGADARSAWERVRQKVLRKAGPSAALSLTHPEGERLLVARLESEGVPNARAEAQKMLDDVLTDVVHYRNEAYGICDRLDLYGLPTREARTRNAILSQEGFLP